MYIKDIEPIGDIGVELLEKENAEEIIDEIIDEIIEEPLKKPIKAFYKKGIKTVMSSANKNNIVPKGEKPKNKEDVKGEYLFLDRGTFEDAGVGYTWIMLDFDTLSVENKEILLKLEEREDENGNKVGEEAIWFVHPTIMGNIDYQMKTGRFNYSLLGPSAKDEKPIEIVKVDPQYVKFEDKAIILPYNNRYPANTVILRMPVNENTAVEEVEEYFCKIAELLKSQRIKEVENNIEDEGRDI